MADSEKRGPVPKLGDSVPASRDAMDSVERMIASEAGKAWHRAKEDALAAGHSVVVGDGSDIVRIHPGGGRVVIGRTAGTRQVRRPLKGAARWKLKPPASES